MITLSPLTEMVGTCSWHARGSVGGR